MREAQFEKKKGLRDYTAQAIQYGLKIPRETKARGGFKGGSEGSRPTEVRTHSRLYISLPADSSSSI